MNEYTLEEFLEDIQGTHQADGAPIVLAPARPQREQSATYIEQTPGITIRDTVRIGGALGPEGSGTLDRFDIWSSGRRTSTWWIPGLTRAQHEVYQTLRRDGMGVPEAQNAAIALS